MCFDPHTWLTFPIYGSCLEGKAPHAFLKSQTSFLDRTSSTTLPIDQPCIVLSNVKDSCPLWFNAKLDFPPARATSIFYTTNLIHDEAISILYSSTIFSFLDLEHFGRFTMRISEVAQAKVAHVCILLPFSWSTDRTASSIVKRLPGLRTLSLASRYRYCIEEIARQFRSDKSVHPLPDKTCFTAATLASLQQEVDAGPGPTVYLPPVLHSLCEWDTEESKIFYVRLVRVPWEPPLPHRM